MYHASIFDRRPTRILLIQPSLISLFLHLLGKSLGSFAYISYNENNTIVLPPGRMDTKGIPGTKSLSPYLVTAIITKLASILRAR